MTMIDLYEGARLASWGIGLVLAAIVAAYMDVALWRAWKRGNRNRWN